MNDKKWIIAGLAVVVVVALFPIWYAFTAGESKARPELELPADETRCVEGREYMVANHMNLLNDWRDRVVREGEKTYTSEAYGTTYEMSLTRTCLGCHATQQTFCLSCHDYAGVDPYCWDCHLQPEEIEHGRE
jgi:hypothetical protein